MSTFNTVYHALVDTVGRRPSAPALRSLSRTFTYAELMDCVNCAAERLRDIGIEQGDVFAVFAQNCAEILFCYYAAAKLGAVYVPINPNMTSSEVRYIVGHCGAKRLFHDEYCAEVAAQAVELQHLSPLVDLARASGPASSSIDPTPTSPHDDFLIIYTSGTTGTPKAVLLDHDAQVAVCESLIRMWALTDRDITIVALPLGYLYGLSTAAAVSLGAGGMVVILPKFRPDDVLEALLRFRGTVFHGVPTMFTMMLEYGRQNDVHRDLSGVRQLISAGAPLLEETVERFRAQFNGRLQNYYAATECTPIFGAYADDLSLAPQGAIGRKAPGTSVKVLDRVGNECGPGVDGELFVRAPATMKGYFKDPVQTAASLKDGWFATGDLGHFDGNGYYYLTGRIKEIIIRGGANIAPAEVEAVLAAHPAVQEIAVLGAPDSIFGEVPVAFVVFRPQSAASAEELQHYAAASLAEFKVPRHFAFVNGLPIGKTGKVDKNALRKQWTDSHQAAAR